MRGPGRLNDIQTSKREYTHSRTCSRRWNVDLSVTHLQMRQTPDTGILAAPLFAKRPARPTRRPAKGKLLTPALLDRFPEAVLVQFGVAQHSQLLLRLRSRDALGKRSHRCLRALYASVPWALTTLETQRCGTRVASYLRTRAFMWNQSARIYAPMRRRMCVSMCPRIYVFAYIPMCLCLHICVSACLCINEAVYDVCMHARACVFVCQYVRTRCVRKGLGRAQHDLVVARDRGRCELHLNGMRTGHADDIRIYACIYACARAGQGPDDLALPTVNVNDRLVPLHLA